MANWYTAVLVETHLRIEAFELLVISPIENRENKLVTSLLPLFHASYS